MTRIGHLLAYPLATTGVGAVINGLRELDPHSPLLVAAEGPGGGVRRGMRMSVPWEVVPVDEQVLAQTHDLDVLVVHGVFNPACARVARAVLRRQVRPAVLAFPHDAYDAGLFSSRRLAKQLYFRAVERPWLSRADGIVVTAPSHLTCLRAHGITAPALACRLGLSEVEREQAAVALGRGRHRAASDRLRVLFLGRWDVHEKGLDVLLAAVARVPDVELRVVGPPIGARARLEQLARPAAGAVSLVGFVDDVGAELAQADLLVLPSRKEGFGLVGLQALAAGVPVLLSRRAGLAEAVSEAEGVVLVEPQVDDVVRGLQEASGRLPELTSAARTFASGRARTFDYTGVRDALLELAQVAAPA